MKRNTQKWQHKDLSPKYLPFQIWPSIKASVISCRNDLWRFCLMTVEKTVCSVRGSWVFYSSSWNREKVDWCQNTWGTVSCSSWEASFIGFLLKDIASLSLLHTEWLKLKPLGFRMLWWSTIALSQNSHLPFTEGLRKGKKGHFCVLKHWPCC